MTTLSLDQIITVRPQALELGELAALVQRSLHDGDADELLCLLADLDNATAALRASVTEAVQEQENPQEVAASRALKWAEHRSTVLWRRTAA